MSYKCPNCGQETREKYCTRCGTPTTASDSRLKNKLYKPTYIVGAIWILGCLMIAPDQLKEMSIFEFLSTSVVGLLIFCGITQIICKKKRLKKSQTGRSDVYDFTNTLINYKDEEAPKSVNPYPKTSSYDEMDGHAFEYYCADVLKYNGFQNIEVTKGSGDQGLDVLATKDGIKYGIQCKCYSSDIGNKAVQEAFSGKTFYNCHVAVVLTNRYFTQSAKELAHKNGVLLWDRDKLNNMIAQCPSVHTPKNSTFNKVSTDDGCISVDEARKIIQPHINNEYLKVLYRQYPNDKVRVIKLFKQSQNLSLSESKRIVDEFYKMMK